MVSHRGSVMLSPSLVILSEAKDPAISLRVNSAKHLCILPVNRGESSMGFPERQMKKILRSEGQVNAPEGPR